MTIYFLSVCVCVCACAHVRACLRVSVNTIVCVGRSKGTEDNLGCLQVSVSPLLSPYLRQYLLLLTAAHTRLSPPSAFTHGASPSSQWYFNTEATGDSRQLTHQKALEAGR